MTTVRASVAYAIAAGLGAVGWIGISQLTHRREAWDSELYFSWFLPSAALVIAGLAFFAPERSWRWAFTPFGAQAVVATVQNPGANLLPLGLLVFAFLRCALLDPGQVGSGPTPTAGAVTAGLSTRPELRDASLGTRQAGA